MEREITQDEGYRRGEKPAIVDRVLFATTEDDTGKVVELGFEGGKLVLTIWAEERRVEFRDASLTGDDVEDLIRALQQAQEVLSCGN